MNQRFISPERKQTHPEGNMRDLTCGCDILQSDSNHRQLLSKRTKGTAERLKKKSIFGRPTLIHQTHKTYQTNRKDVEETQHFSV
uniref:Uncharacterized protein n=1 Tax=Cyprinodon variegatus TaxID=28743 RepID=A0A3Q2DVG8_CYPVA